MACEEEGLTFDNGTVVRHRRWRASPALATVLPAHPCPVHGMRQSADGRWLISGGDDLHVRLWDTEAYARTLADPDSKKAAQAADRAGAVAANVSLGWECVRELVGHTAAVRDVEFNPLFNGPPRARGSDGGKVRGQGGGEGDTGVGGRAEQRRASGGTTAVRTEKKRAGEDLRGVQWAPVRVECMLASASADLTVRIWDLSFNPRIARCVCLAVILVVGDARVGPKRRALAQVTAAVARSMLRVGDDDISNARVVKSCRIEFK